MSQGQVVNSQVRLGVVFGGGLVLCFFGVLFGLLTGSAEQLDWGLVWDLRVPRVLLALGAGSALSVSGVLLQALFTNPMADPYTLGVSSGAALFAVLGASLGIRFHWLGFDGAALLGALLFSVILMSLARRGTLSLLTLLLFGMMLGFIGSSGVALIVALTRSEEVMSATRWLFGDLSRAELSSSTALLVLSVVATGFVSFRARIYDALLLGEEDAASLGLHLRRVRVETLMVVSLLTSAGVGLCGMIGFVGLVVPHLVRTQIGATHGRLLPAAALWGAGFLVCADAFSKWIARPYELPVGVITSLLGAPLFLFILFNRKKTYRAEGL
jgi:iron complex transport system permease protein